jgi:hypothetical protein
LLTLAGVVLSFALTWLQMLAEVPGHPFMPAGIVNGHHLL